MEIRIRFTGSVIYKDDSKTMKETVANAILSKIDLRGSDLSGSDLSGSNLSYCDLRGSDLSGSNLSGSNLSGSNLKYCNLKYCNLSYCDLSGSNLSGSNLKYCNLSYCDLKYCNLSGSGGLKYAQISFSGFGERNRLISLIDINRDGNPIFFCGCFSGTNEELINHIEQDKEEYKESRHFARKTLLEAIKFSNIN